MQPQAKGCQQPDHDAETRIAIFRKRFVEPFAADSGFVGEFRVGLLNDMRWGERKLPRMVDRCGALALPKNAVIPRDWPLPELVVPPADIAAWRKKTS